MPTAVSLRNMPTSLEDKQRILDAAARGQQWQLVAVTLDVPYKTAWRWVDNATRTDNWVAALSRRGGFRYERVTEPMKELLVQRLENNCHLTLREMADVLQYEFDVQVCEQTVKRAINGVGYTIKMIHQQSELMNTEANKQQRYEYVVQLLTLQSQGMCRACYHMRCFLHSTELFCFIFLTSRKEGVLR